jgi:hypothetical protein
MSKTYELSLFAVVVVLGSAGLGCGGDKPAQDPSAMTADPAASSTTPPTAPTATAPATPEATPPAK